MGDIIGMIDDNGVQVVSYTYDSFGKLISIKDSAGNDVTNNTSHVGYKNPYRYRAYRYDNETGLYYLQSRYYDPEIGRFINADGILGAVGDLLAHNLFSYCRNNPINRTDIGGFVDVTLEQWGDFGISEPTIFEKTLNNVDNFLSDPVISAVASKPDASLGNIVGKVITASKKIKLDGTMGLTDYIRNVGPLGKFAGAFVAGAGVISLVTMGIGITNNFVNYANPWARTLTDLGSFGAGFGIGVLLAALNPVGILAVASVAALSILATAGIAWINNEIKDEYFSERKR